MENRVYHSFKLEWCRVSDYIQKVISEILGREIICTTKTVGPDFWAVSLTDSVFSLSELKRLLDFVKADNRTVEETMPEDSNETKYIGMLLSSELLMKALGVTWQEEHITEEALWLLGVIDYF